MKKNFAKVLSVFLAVLMLMSVVPMTAGAETNGDYTYTVSDGKAMITDVDTSISGDIIIPSTLDGYPVTAIAYKAFYTCKNITSIVIPENVKNIYGYAFEYCTALESVTVHNAFIADYAFSNCSNLKTVTTGDGITEITYNMFYLCSSIESFLLGENVSSIDVGHGGFGNLSEFIVDSANPYFSADANGVLFNKDKTKIIQFPEGSSLTSYKIPDTVTTIGNSAFSFCKNLLSVTIPASVKTIENSAFAYCDGFTDITIPENVIQVGNDAFATCKNLKTVTIADGVESLGARVFMDCVKLETVSIPASVKTIGEKPFLRCESLQTFAVDENNYNYSNDEYGVLFNKEKTHLIQYVLGSDAIQYVIPDTVITIESYSFSRSLTLTSVIIPLSVENIREHAFYIFYATLSDVYYKGSNSDWNKINIERNYALDDAEIHFNYCEHSYVTSVTPPTCTEQGYTTYTCECGDSYVSDYVDAAHLYVDGICSVCYAVEIIADGTCGTDAFWTLDVFGTLTVSGTGAMSDYEYNTAPWTENRDLIKRVVIDGNLSNIGEYAFSRCANITSIELGSTITEIGECAFEDCVALSELNIPSSVKTLGLMAFEDCIALKNVTLNSGLETIGSHAFYDCTALESIDIPASVTLIDDHAFGYCESLEAVNIGDGDVVIKYSAFGHCTNLKSVYIEGADKVDLGAFDKVKTITILDDLTEITDYYSLSKDTVFYGKKNSTTADYTQEYSRPFVPIDVSDDYVVSGGKIGDTAQFEITKGGVLNILGSGEMYNYSAITKAPFNNYHHHIKSAVVSNGITAIGSFSSCEKITELYIPATVASFGIDTFDGCTALNDIYYYGTEAQWALIDDSYLGAESKENLSNATIHFNYCPVNENFTHVITSTVTPNTCTQDGYTTNVCDCGYTYITDKTEATGHDYKSYVYQSATHIYTGIRMYECKNCTYYYTTTIPKTEGHTYKKVVTAPTCTEQGFTTYTCACGDTYTADYVDVTGHSHTGKVTTEATHLTDGVITYTCHCGDTYTEAIPKLENQHSYSSAETAPTCTEQGYTTYTCECGDSYIADYVKENGHSHTGKVTTAATHLAEGVMTYTCHCGDTYTEAINKLTKHTYKSEVTTAATHTAQGVKTYTCECGDTYTVAIPTTPDHTYQKETIKKATCTENGTRLYFCECGSEYTETISATGHKDTNGDVFCDSCGTAVCSHMCHKTGFMGFIWKIVQFFWKLFNMNPVCECGLAHY